MAEDLSEEIWEIAKDTLEHADFVKWYASRWQYLNDQTPEQWLLRGGDPETVRRAAHRYMETAQV